MTILLDEYKKNTVKPLNGFLIPDPLANPKYHGDKWAPGILINFNESLIIKFSFRMVLKHLASKYSIYFFFK